MAHKLKVQRNLFHQQTETSWVDCTRCPALAACRKKVVLGELREITKILVVGQWPGLDEDKTGIPFRGELGQLCRDLLASCGMDPRFTGWTNILACKPSEQEPYLPTFADNCEERLDQEIARSQPLVIVAIGKIATQRLIGFHGRLVPEVMMSGTYKGREVRALTHPAILGHLIGQKRLETEALLRTHLQEIARTYLTEE